MTGRIVLLAAMLALLAVLVEWRLVGGDGVLQTFPLPLNEQESGLLHDSARVIRTALDELLKDQ